MPTEITEAFSGAAETAGPGRIKMRLISPGWGSSGYYSPQVLENAATDKVWPAGTHIYFDHPSESEIHDRPERSVRDLAAVTTEDATWDGAGLVAEAKVIGPYRDLVTDDVFTEAVGMSIRASAETTTGEAGGRKGVIVSRLVEGQSVDLVTRAGRGGKVLAVLESARAEARETLAGETRDMLAQALDGNGWVVDFDPDKSTVVYRREWREGDEYRSEMLRATFTVNGTNATVNDDGVPVRQQVTYVPTAATGDATETTSQAPSVPAPAGQSTNTQESEEDTMPQIEEARLRQLEADAGRVQTADTERDTALAEVARYRARETARPIAAQVVGESDSLPTTTQTRVVESVLADLPTPDDGTLDETAFRTAVEAARTSAEAEVAQIAEALGAGKVTGFGGQSTNTGEISEADFRHQLPQQRLRRVRDGLACADLVEHDRAEHGRARHRVGPDGCAAAGRLPRRRQRHPRQGPVDRLVPDARLRKALLPQRC